VTRRPKSIEKERASAITSNTKTENKNGKTYRNEGNCECESKKNTVSQQSILDIINYNFNNTNVGKMRIMSVCYFILILIVILIVCLFCF